MASCIRKQKILRTTDRLKGVLLTGGLSFVRFVQLDAFLGAFSTFRKASVTSSYLSVRPSAWKAAPTGRIFMKFDI